MFDPDSGKVIDREALRSIAPNIQPAGAKRPRKFRHNGDENRTTEVLDQSTGEVYAHSTEYRHSDRVDGTVFAKPAVAGTKPTQ